ncbi:MAG: glycogen synthase GlgA [Gammaproteobacteria bacterium]|nr:MAG: glycogen synthase GlgA [Gammaproteobacteria bacterium]
MSKLLFVASEAFPLIKTGGLADVAGSLPDALAQLGMDVRLLLPAYHAILSAGLPTTHLANISLGSDWVELLETKPEGSSVTVWLVRHPDFSDRPGNPYHDEHHNAWLDNPARFARLCKVAAAIATGEAWLDWQPDILHCNDWHTGPAIALAKQHDHCPLTVFTIHNLRHQGSFDRDTFDQLHFPPALWSMNSGEFYGNFNFMKAALSHADIITTVSPGYASEILNAPGGMGLEDVLSHRRTDIHGITNGIDTALWNPATDEALPARYSAADPSGKIINKQQHLRDTGLSDNPDTPLFGFIGRLDEQKGLDILLPNIERLAHSGACVTVLGSGEKRYEQALGELAARFPAQIAVTIGYDEGLAHRIEAAADVFLMPSLFEPCGLNQLYSLRYGTLPLVRRVGGLADTVTDTNPTTLREGSATGLVFNDASTHALWEAIERALALWQKPDTWRRVRQNAMAQDVSWRQSAARYLSLYRQYGEKRA